MSFTYTNSIFTLVVLFVLWCYSYGACPSLISTETLTVTCQLNNKSLDNCKDPMEGTEAYLTCNRFYEEVTLEANPKRLCRAGTWDGPIPACYTICGIKRVKESSNSEEDQNKLLDYPWHVGIYFNDKIFLCGGTLIAMDKVLTAARCVTFQNTYKINIDLIKTIFVGAGKYYLGFNDSRDKYDQYSTVQQVHVPEEYARYKIKFSLFDIAILVLTDSFRPTQFVQPICLNFDSSSYNSLLQDIGILTGWDSTIIYYSNFGMTGVDPVRRSDVLKVATVLYIPFNKCSSRVNMKYKDYIAIDQICGENLNNVTIACTFNVGGGMALKNKINDRYYIIGVHSPPPKELDIFTYDPNQYSLYTNISYHQMFVKSYAAYIEMKNCVLPNHPLGGEYVVFPNKMGTYFEYKIGHPVPSHSRLILHCDNRYDTTHYVCSKNGRWNPILKGCIQNDTDLITLPIDKSTSLNYTYIILIVSAVVIIVFALIAVILYHFKFKQDWEIQREIKSAGLYHFHNGNLKRFNPELGIGGQAELLPYNNNFEFSRDKLKLGRQLGSGAFGIVMQADAFGIIPHEEKTTVAVKMVKNVTDHVHIKALISELKIMIHLGQHLNVVNLLGACTENITKRELLVIVEYCQFGNLYNYLLQNRKNYINQIDNARGSIDYSLGTKDGTNLLPDPDNSSVTSSEDNVQESIKPISTKVLISWSFQVARGMEYLASRKILHGDLAARNILLSDNNIVKICDFGLAKKMLQTMNYKQQQDSPLPIKWMAIESIRDRVFSTQSDVWSFGIVLWEFFSLAQTPYPGMEADERLYYKLLDGYKMESPPYAPKEMYKIMCDCWSFDPESRPCFNELAGRVGLMLEVNVRQQYIDLNDPYFVMNTQRISGNQEDYLVTLNPSGCQQISIPHSYINNNQPVRTSGNIYTTRTVNPAMNKIANISNNENVSTVPNDYLVVIGS